MKNWKSSIKWVALGVGCLAAIVVGFVLAQYVAAGSEFEGSLADLAPADCTTVVMIDKVPERRAELDTFLEEGLLARTSFRALETSPFWQEHFAESFPGGLALYKQEKIDAEVQEAERAGREAGVDLFRDVFSGEMLICTDASTEPSGMLVLTRVSRDVRFKWRFLGMAEPFFPAPRPGEPRLRVQDGVLTVTPGRTNDAAPESDDDAPSSILITVLDDVLVVSSSPRLFNATLENHNLGGGGISNQPLFQRANELIDDAGREQYTAVAWMNLDLMREYLDPVEKNGRLASPVDAYNSLPVEFLQVNYDIFGPVNRILEKDLDTRPFGAACFGFDLSDTASVRFDQFLIADPSRMQTGTFAHLRETFEQPMAAPDQLSFLPDDVVMQVSYRQPVDVLHDKVLDETARASLIGDFVKALKDDPVEETVFAVMPVRYAPGLVDPISQAPMPGFLFAFRLSTEPGETLPREVLDRYLANLRGRKTDEEGKPKKSALSVRPDSIAGKRIYGLDYRTEGEEDSFAKLARSLLCGANGRWLLLTNSRLLLESIYGGGEGLYQKGRAPWNDLPAKAGATVYVRFEGLEEYIGRPDLLNTLRENRFNPTLPEGMDPADLRKAITAELGLDPDSFDDLTSPRVEAEYTRRETEWRRKCETEGPAWTGEIRRDLAGLTFFQDLAMFTTFADDHLRMRGVLRVRPGR